MIRKTFLVLATLLFCATGSFAQTEQPLSDVNPDKKVEKVKKPLYRKPGYKGSLTFTDQSLFTCGVETSHGYMFNAHNYFGAGAGVFFLLLTDPVMDFFLEYKGYFSKKNFSPTIGLQAGFINEELTRSDGNGVERVNTLHFFPNVGLSWMLGKRIGIFLELGASFYIDPNNRRDEDITPQLNVGIEF